MRWLLIACLLSAQGIYADTLVGTVTAIADGDTLTVLDAQKRQHRVRLAEIDAPEKRQAFGTQARQSLSALCFRKETQIEWHTKGRNKRLVGHVTCAGIDANAEQVRRGMAWVSPRFTKTRIPVV